MFHLRRTVLHFVQMMLHFVQMMLPAANDVVLRTNDVAPCGAQIKVKIRCGGFFHLIIFRP